jgi:hypothetical protein
MWAVLLAAKNNASDAIKRVQAAAEAQSGRTTAASFPQ